MMKEMKTYITMVAAGLAIFCSLVLFNQFAQIYVSAAAIHPFFGYFVLVCLLIILAVCIIYPVMQLLRLPKIILPPADEDSPDYQRYRQQLARLWRKTRSWPKNRSTSPIRTPACRRHSTASMRRQTRF